MRIKNKLKKLLEDLGIKTMVPSDNLLTNKLGGMTLNRFNQIVNNDSKTELSVLEVSNLKKWLSEVTGQPVEAIMLLEDKELVV